MSDRTKPPEGYEVVRWRVNDDGEEHRPYFKQENGERCDWMAGASEEEAIAACHTHADRQRAIGREETLREISDALAFDPEALSVQAIADFHSGMMATRPDVAACEHRGYERGHADGAADAETAIKTLRAQRDEARALAEYWADKPWRGPTADGTHSLPWLAATTPAEEPTVKPRALHLDWNGVEWVDDRCGCRYHPDDENGSHGGAPHVHRCEQHKEEPAPDRHLDTKLDPMEVTVFPDGHVEVWPKGHGPSEGGQ